MTNLYYPGILPEDYNQAFLVDEFAKIAGALAALEIPTLTLVPQAVEPVNAQEGMTVNADGTNWNPGHGTGLYEWDGTEWIPLFSTNEGFVTSQTLVENTTTETAIYSGTLAADSLHVGDLSQLLLGGSYDTGAASDTWTLRLYFGGTLIHTILRQSANNLIGAGWRFTMEGSIRTGGVSGTLVDLLVLHDDNTAFADSDTTPHTVDTTIDNVLEVTIQWGAAKVANIFRLDHGIIEHKH